MKTDFEDTLPDGTVVHVRPINRSDVERERAFIDGLSRQSKYYRFLGGVSHLTEEELQQFCDVDRVRSMAFVALVPRGGQESQVGVTRFVADASTGDAEIALTVADDWKNSGLDQILLRHLIDYAGSIGIDCLYSVELASNTDIIKLAREFGFSVDTDPEDARQVILRLSLTPPQQSATV